MKFKKVALDLRTETGKDGQKPSSGTQEDKYGQTGDYTVPEISLSSSEDERKLEKRVFHGPEVEGHSVINIPTDQAKNTDNESESNQKSSHKSKVEVKNQVKANAKAIIAQNNMEILTLLSDPQSSDNLQNGGPLPLITKDPTAPESKTLKEKSMESPHSSQQNLAPHQSETKSSDLTIITKEVAERWLKTGYWYGETDEEEQAILRQIPIDPERQKKLREMEARDDELTEKYLATHPAKPLTPSDSDDEDNKQDYSSPSSSGGGDDVDVEYQEI